MSSRRIRRGWNLALSEHGVRAFGALAFGSSIHSPLLPHDRPRKAPRAELEGVRPALGTVGVGLTPRPPHPHRPTLVMLAIASFGPCDNIRPP